MSRSTPMPDWWLDFVASDPDVTVTDPDNPPSGRRPTWGYIVRRTLREFSRDECTVLAAALTYYSILCLLPAALALLSLLALLGLGPETLATGQRTLTGPGLSSAAETMRPILRALGHAPGPGLALAVGLGTALWSASGYVRSFGRAMNRIYHVGEGRPLWKLRPLMLLLTLLVVVLTVLVSLGLVLTGPVAAAIGQAIGVGSTAVLVWDIAKWPVLMFAVVLIVGLLYHATPNVKLPRYRWMSGGASVAIVVWLVASGGFGLYVANISHFSKTYGAVTGVVVLLMWLWITNVALLFGAELDAEFERSRELRAGMPAEVAVQLPARDTHRIMKAARKLGQDVEEGRRVRTGY